MRPAGTPSRAIAFTSHRDGVSINVVDTEGNRPIQLTSGSPPSFHPSFSPNGQTVAFSRGEDIYSIRCDDGIEVALTGGPPSDDEPVFSPDGRTIAFTRDHGSGADIHVMDADGTDRTRLTNHPAPDYDPTFSPDGTEIAFTRGRPGGDIYVMDADGGDETALTGSRRKVDVHEFGPSFSPDGDRIAFTRDQRGGGDIYLMDADGDARSRLTRDPASSSDEDPAFSPDGERIAFTSYRGPASTSAEIFVMNSHGREAVALTSNDVFDGDPNWRPTPPGPTSAGARAAR